MSNFLHLNGAEVVKRLADEHSLVPTHLITDTADLRRDLRMDDTAVVGFAISLEQEFGGALTDDQIENMKTIADAIALATVFIDGAHP